MTKIITTTEDPPEVSEGGGGGEGGDGVGLGSRVDGITCAAVVFCGGVVGVGCRVVVVG